MSRIALCGILSILFWLSGCGDEPWNNPYPLSQSRSNIYYDVFGERPKHLDPISSYSANEYIFLGQIYEPPLQYHFLKRPYELTTLTATELPEVEYFDAAGNRLDADAPAEAVHRAIYRINIRPGILFQPHPAFAKDDNGNYRYHHLDRDDIARFNTLADFSGTGTRELTAEDYLYQIKRFAHPGVHSPVGGLKGKYILGLQELSEQLAEKYADNPHPGGYIDLREYDLEGVKIIDRYTYEIILKEKYPQFIYWLAMPFFSPMPWEADRFYSQPGMKEKNIVLNWYPVGTGPYMLTENNPNLRMVMERNPNFRGEIYPHEGEEGDRAMGFLDDAGKTMPFIDKAVYSLEVESIPAWNKFLQGYYDVSTIQSDSFDQAIQFNAQGDAELTPEMREKNIRLLTAVTTSVFYMGFNMLDDVVGGDSERARLLRRAVSIAVDHDEYISIFTNGRGVPAQGPLPPGIFGHIEGEAGINPYVYKWENGKAVRRSVKEAQELMKKAGYPNGRDQKTGRQLILYLDTPAAGPGTKAVFDWYRKQFDKLGINLVIRATDYNRFQDKMLKGTAQIFMWGWNADYPDPENFMFLLYGPNTKANKNGENAANYQNREFDQLFNRMKSLPNGPERQTIINQMVEILRADAPWIWGFHPVAFALHHDWYSNAKPNLMSNNTLKYKHIDPELRYDRRKQWNQPVLWPVILLAVLLFISIIPAWFTWKRRERAGAL
jgi:ABC-type transport system substrate-binding protein